MPGIPRLYLLTDILRKVLQLSSIWKFLKQLIQFLMTSSSQIYTVCLESGTVYVFASIADTESRNV